MEVLSDKSEEEEIKRPKKRLVRQIVDDSDEDSDEDWQFKESQDYATERPSAKKITKSPTVPK